MKPVLPPATIGIMGGGQLGMMLVREAQRMGYRTCVWEPTTDCPASRLADQTITSPYDDSAALEKFAGVSDVITYEFENIDVDPVAELELLRPLAPASGILSISQNRSREKYELQRRGFPTVPYEIARSREGVAEAIRQIGGPAVVKTTTSGYDGKGQAIIRNTRDAISFVKSLGSSKREYIVEKFAKLKCELSVIGARSRDGRIVIFPVGENEHIDNILHITRVPARIPADLRLKAAEIGKNIMESLDVVGVLCIELFVTEAGELLVNELAPRPHNSGHYTLDACSISQFEALLRALCGLPITKPHLFSACAMINILGDDIERLDYDLLMKEEGIKVHLYGKRRVQQKRKMGHITIMKPTAEAVEKTLRRVEKMLANGK